LVLHVGHVSRQVLGKASELVLPAGLLPYVWHDCIETRASYVRLFVMVILSVDIQTVARMLVFTFRFDHTNNPERSSRNRVHAHRG
jgi:hypothetical protein